MLDRTRKELIQAVLIEINQLNIDNRAGKGAPEDNIGILCIMLNLINNWKTETVSAKTLWETCEGNRKMEAGYNYLDRLVD